ncbi:MAG: hypothetical protein J2P36_17310, partial [Ktedonobacteraceae bacterium]|nr:hypothetical protein [Ktedonobacteraceae bacterium]
KGFLGPLSLIPTTNGGPLVQTANAAGAAGFAQAVCKESSAPTAARSGGRSSSTPNPDKGPLLFRSATLLAQPLERFRQKRWALVQPANAAFAATAAPSGGLQGIWRSYASRHLTARRSRCAFSRAEKQPPLAIPADVYFSGEMASWDNLPKPRTQTRHNPTQPPVEPIQPDTAAWEAG